MPSHSPYGEKDVATKPSQKEEINMNHKLMISVANESPTNGIVACKKKTVKKRLFKRLFGTEPDRVTIIIPGDSVKDVTIQQVKENGGFKNE